MTPGILVDKIYVQGGKSIMIQTLMNPKQIIADRVAKEMKDGDVVNLGIGFQQWFQTICLIP